MGPVESLTRRPEWRILAEAWERERAAITRSLDTALDDAPSTDRAFFVIARISGERAGFHRAIRVIDALIRAERRTLESQQKEPTNGRV